VSDRYLLANIVYQGHAGGLDPEAIRRVGAVAKCPFIGGVGATMFGKKENSFEGLPRMAEMYEIFEASGETPADVIRRERIQRAASMLDDRIANYSVADVAFSTGFGDVTTFTRAFRRYFGVTPRDWRSGLTSPAS